MGWLARRRERTLVEIREQAVRFFGEAVLCEVCGRLDRPHVHITDEYDREVRYEVTQ